MYNSLLSVTSLGGDAWSTTKLTVKFIKYRGTDKSLARPTYPCILFDCENITFDTSLVIFI